jgi:hypothetical protein
MIRELAAVKMQRALKAKKNPRTRGIPAGPGATPTTGVTNPPELEGHRMEQYLQKRCLQMHGFLSTLSFGIGLCVISNQLIERRHLILGQITEPNAKAPGGEIIEGR